MSDSAGELWIVKVSNSIWGGNSLANELIGSRLCTALGLPVPECRLLSLSRSLFNDPDYVSYLDCERFCPENLHFATRYLPEAKKADMMEYPPSTLSSCVINKADCLGMLLFDIWAMHVDRRQALFSIEPNGIRATFFDHGELFGGHSWQSNYVSVNGGFVQRVALDFLQQGGRCDDWIAQMQMIIPSALRSTLAELPNRWSTGDIGGLLKILDYRLANLHRLVNDSLRNLRTRVDQDMELEPVRTQVLQLLTPDGKLSWHSL